MNKLFKNKYSPTNINNVVGDYSMVKLFIEQNNGKPLILYGEPGTGKTTIVNVIANHFNMDINIINASDERNNINLGMIYSTSLITNKRKLIVFDECDGLTDKTFKKLSTIISNYSPIIIICNDINKIPNIIKAKSFIKNVKVDKFTLKILANKIIELEKLEISNDQLNKALINIKSYRQLLDYLQFGNIPEFGSFATKENIQDSLIFTNDNSENPDLISIADINLGRVKRGYKNGELISKYIIGKIDKKTSNYPRTYKMIYEAKKPKKNNQLRIMGFK